MINITHDIFATIIISLFISVFTVFSLLQILKFTRMRRSWMIIGIAVLFLIIGQFIELYNLRFNENNTILLYIYFIINSIVAIVINLAIFRMSKLLKNQADRSRKG